MTRARRRRAGFAAAVVTMTLAVGGCGTGSADGPRLGPAHELGSGTARTFVTLDPAGRMTELGVRLTADAVNGPPTGTAPTALMLELPQELAAAPFRDVMLDWNPRGHAPTTLFGKPHFDVHFDMVDMSELGAITPTDPQYAEKAARLPDARHVPAGFAMLPGPPAAEQAVPGMGLHLADAATRPVPGRYDFRHILLAGSWNGRYTFIEPMLARDWLLTEPAFEEPVARPAAYQQNGRYPGRYTVRFDRRSDTYEIVLTDFEDGSVA